MFYLLNKLLVVLLVFSPIASFSIEPSKEYATFACAPCCGFFRTMASLVGMLKLYEQGRFAGLKVDFSLTGPYYEPEHGPNWWEYYFEPIHLGEESNTIPFYTFNGPHPIDCAMDTEFGMTRDEVHAILSRYVHPKPHILKRVDDFVEKNFQGKDVIGIHYRGTDKWSEAPKASYRAVVKHVTEVIDQQQKNKRKIRIFIATDEQPFLDFMKERFPNRIIVNDNASRSSTGEPVHKSQKNCYQNGEDALVDCLLLSKCKVLVKTSSNLSLFSTYFNPDIPVVNVTMRH